MSGIVTSNVFRGSGVIAATPGGLDWSTAVVTGSTLTATAGKGYFINTTSNTCTVTLPSSAEIGDQIVFVDYARTWATYELIIDSNGLNFQGDPDAYTVDYDTAGQSLNIVYSDATKGWLPVSDDAVADVGTPPPTQKGIFAQGYAGGANRLNMSNLVTSSGVIGNDVTGVGTVRMNAGAASYGGDKAIFAFGDSGSATNISNLVNSSGVMQNDTTGVGTARQPKAAEYGNTLAVFYGGTGGISNKVSSSGVVATDTSGVGTARSYLAGVRYGGDKAVFAYGGGNGAELNVKNLVSNTGVVSADATGVGTARYGLSAAAYGGDKGAFAYGTNGGSYVSLKNLVSNSGVIAADVTGVGTARNNLAACSYGGDKGVFAYGGNSTPGAYNLKNLMSNTGIIAADVTGVGTAREALCAAGYSQSA